MGLTRVVSKQDLLITTLEAYIKLLTEETGGLCAFVSAHGWRSLEATMARGEMLRAKIEKLKGLIEVHNGITAN